MKSIILSFSPDWFEKLESGLLKHEYRYNFPDSSRTLVYFYVSRPVKAITGIALMGAREQLKSWEIKYESRGPAVVSRINDYLQDCRYAIPIISFQKTNQIPLDQLNRDLGNFVVPRMYYFIDGTTLSDYLEQNLKPIGEPYKPDLNIITDDDICPDF